MLVGTLDKVMKMERKAQRSRGECMVDHAKEVMGAGLCVVGACFPVPTWWKSRLSCGVDDYGTR